MMSARARWVWFLVSTAAVPVRADDAVPEPVVPEAPGEAPPQSYEQHRIEEIRRRARVTRNAFIGTSTATAIGFPLFLSGIITQCEDIPRIDGTNEINCTTAGALMVGFGTPLMFGGGLGMITTGIMFGVRKRKIRRLERGLPTAMARRVHWDSVRGQWMF